MKIKKMVKHPEGRRLEFKEHLPSGSNIAKTVIAFTPKQWIEKTNIIGIISKAGRYMGTYGIAKCDAFKAASVQQAVSQLTRISWRQNITKNLPDEFRSSLPSIEEIEAELSGGEESQ